MLKQQPALQDLEKLIKRDVCSAQTSSPQSDDKALK